MLDFLRRSVKSWVAKVLLGLLILSFAVWGIGDMFTSGATGPVAQVGNTEVASEKFMDTILRQQNMLSRQRGELVTLQDLRDAGYDQSALRDLIRDASIENELSDFSIAVPVDAIANAIRSNASFQDGQGAFSQYTYQQQLAQAGFQPRQYEELVATLLGQRILADAASPGDLALPGIAEAIARFNGEQRAISVATLPIENAPDPGLPDEAALRAYFEENDAAFREPQRRTGRMVYTDMLALASEIEPSEDEVRTAYDSRPDLYSQAATRTVEQIVFDDTPSADAAAKRISEETATFAEIAAEMSLSPDSLGLGTVAAGELPEATDTAVFAATEPGVVGPVDGTFGPVLLNVTGVEQGGTTPFSAVSDRIRAELIEARILAEIPERANAIDDVRAGGANLEEIADQTKLPLVSFTGLARNGSVSEGTRPIATYDPRMVAEIFESEEGEERDLLELTDGTYALVMIDSIAEAYQPELADIRDRVVAAWQADERLTTLQASAVGMISGMPADQPFADIAANAGASIQTLDAFTRTAAPSILSADLVEQTFSADENGMIVGPNRAGNGILIIRVTAIAGLDDEALDETAAEIRASLLQSISSDQVEYLARALEERHGAEIFPGTIDAVFQRLGQYTQPGGQRPAHDG